MILQRIHFQSAKIRDRENTTQNILDNFSKMNAFVITSAKRNSLTITRQCNLETLYLQYTVASSSTATVYSLHRQNRSELPLQKPW